MIIKTLIGLKVLGLTFLGGMAAVKVLKECCNKKTKTPITQRSSLKQKRLNKL